MPADVVSERDYPIWWRDVHRSLLSAFSEYTGVLNAIEYSYTENPSISYQKLKSRSDALGEQSKSLVLAQSRMHASLKLAQNRNGDLVDSGHRPISLAPYQDIVSALILRTANLQKQLKTEMTKIADELQKRHKRPPKRKIFNEQAPSQIDLRL